MSTLHHVLAIGQNSMMASRQFATVSGNNVGNVNTPGYSRQRLLFESTTVPGLGVRVRGPQAVRDWYLSASLMRKQGDMGLQSGRMGALLVAEPVLNDLEGPGLGAAIAGFQAALQELTANPSSNAQRFAVVASAKELASRFSQTSRQLAEAAQFALDTAESKVAEVNSLAIEIAQLNQQIASAQGTQPPPNEAIDERNLLLERLSTLVNAQFVTHDNGAVSVFVGGGRALVSDGLASKLQIPPPKPLPGKQVELAVVPPSGAGSLKLLAPLGGELGGTFDAYTNSLLPAMNTLDELAYEFTTAFNEQHASGFGLDGSTGVNFWEPLAGPEGAAGALRVSAELESDVNLLAASGSPDDVSGGNDNLLLLTALSTESPITEDGLSLALGWERLTQRVFSDFREAELAAKTEAVGIDQIRAMMASVSGVSVDEELLNLTRANQAFEASARVIKAADEMIQTVLNLTR